MAVEQLKVISASTRCRGLWGVYDHTQDTQGLVCRVQIETRKVELAKKYLKN